MINFVKKNILKIINYIRNDLYSKSKIFKNYPFDKFNFIDPGDNIIFCGIWKVETVKSLIKSNFNKGNIYLFEADPDNYNILIREKQRRNWENVKIFNIAIADKRGEMKFQVSRDSKKNKLNLSGVKSKNCPDEIYDEEIIVEVDTLDNLIEAHNIKPNIIFFTISGAEYYGLKGLERTLNDQQKNNRGLKLWIRALLFDENLKAPTYELSKKYLKSFKNLEILVNSPLEKKNYGCNLFAYFK
jgi:FkbM family methyltransferase